MSDLKKYLDKQLADPAFAEEYEKQRPEYEAIRAMIAARLDSNMTQKELAEKTGIRQSNLSRIENGTCSPTVETLSRIAAGLGKQLKLSSTETKRPVITGRFCYVQNQLHNHKTSFQNSRKVRGVYLYASAARNDFS